MSECPVYVRSIAIATGAAIPMNHDNKRTNREVKRSVMDEVCLADSPEKLTDKQTIEPFSVVCQNCRRRTSRRKRKIIKKKTFEAGTTLTDFFL